MPFRRRLAPKTQRLKRLERIDPVVKRNNRVFKLLIGLVAFSRNQDSVAGPRQTQDFVDRPLGLTCGQLRQRVIDLSEILSESIAAYPLLRESPELVRLHVGLHRILVLVKALGG